MKLLPSWRAVLPVGQRGRVWPWTQQPRSRWALGGLGLGQYCGEQNLSPLDPPTPSQPAPGPMARLGWTFQEAKTGWA